MDRNKKTNPNPPKKLFPSKNLRAGDVLLSLGDSGISRWIVRLTGGKYSHSALFDGEMVCESIKNGVGRFPLEEHLEAQKGGVDGHWLGEPDWSADPVIKVAKRYYKSGTKFSMAQLYLAIPLVVLRRIPNRVKQLRDFIRNCLNPAFELINNAIEAGKEPMTCSELVYRCFAEAVPRKYTLKLKEFNKVKELQKFVSQHHRKYSFAVRGTKDRELQELIREADSIARRYFFAKNKKLYRGFKQRASSRVVADFVSPADLQNSPNLILLGSLRN
jgi:hypothetical protein